MSERHITMIQSNNTYMFDDFKHRDYPVFY